MARLSKEDKFEMRTQNRKDAVKHMKHRVTELNRLYRNTQSLKEQDALSDRIDFLNQIIAKTSDNLKPKRRKPAVSIADVAAQVETDNTHLYDNDRSSLAGADKLLEPVR